MTTIVSAFISNVNTRPDRDLQIYANHGLLLCQSSTPKIIFLDEPMYKIIASTSYNKATTTLIQINANSSYLYDLLPQLTQFQLNSGTPNKDTLKYILTMCNKTEWLREAIHMNPYKSTNFVWIDFGIRHVFKGSDRDFINTLNLFEHKKYDKIRIASIDDLRNPLQHNIFTTVCWYFAGGVVGGNKDALLLFADLMQQECRQIAERHHTLMWEVNIWYLIYTKYKTVFDPYYCDHNNTILTNY